MVKPFLKWVGGKRQLLSQITPLMPASTSRLVEPFAGGAAVFFGTEFQKAWLNDVNPELVNCYRVVQNNAEELISHLSQFRYEKEMFLEVRKWDRQEGWPDNICEIRRAARFIYLNRTAFNGMYRVNAKGQFNVPFGRYTNPTICDAEGLRAASKRLQDAQITLSDFETVLQGCAVSDFVYLDPPYIPVSKTSSFTAYADGGFDMDAQKRLAAAIQHLDKRGIGFALSNACCDAVEALYHPFRLIKVRAGRSINAQADGRGGVFEYIVTNQ